MESFIKSTLVNIKDFKEYFKESEFKTCLEFLGISIFYYARYCGEDIFKSEETVSFLINSSKIEKRWP